MEFTVCLDILQYFFVELTIDVYTVQVSKRVKVLQIIKWSTGTQNSAAQSNWLFYEYNDFNIRVFHSVLKEENLSPKYLVAD